MCAVSRAVRLYPALLNDQLRCVLSRPGEFWQPRPRAGEHWCQKAAYLDGLVHYHLLITGGFSGVFITCTDRGCVYVCVSAGVTVTAAELQGVSCCVSGRRGGCGWGGVWGFLFQLCCRLSAIFMSSVGIGVLCTAHSAFPTPATCITLSNTITSVCLNQDWSYMYHLRSTWEHPYQGKM